MNKRIAILQSNYIPWKGYFDLIAAVDEFVIYDDVQFTKNDWRNRNKVKTPEGLRWLSIPVGQNIRRRVCDVALPSCEWQQSHWATLVRSYGKARHFEDVAPLLEPIYESKHHGTLHKWNRALIEAICTYLGIGTALSNSWDYKTSSDRTQRLVDICVQAGAREYITGPAARAYLDVSVFSAFGITVRWFEYDGYKAYPQLWGEFIHEVSILDLLFNCGPESSDFMRYIRR